MVVFILFLSFLRLFFCLLALTSAWRYQQPPKVVAFNYESKEQQLIRVSRHADKQQWRYVASEKRGV